MTRTTGTSAFWDTPHRPMITHTRDSHQIPSQNKTKWKLQIKKKIAKNSNFKILQLSLQATHLLNLLDKMYKVLQSGHGMRDGRTDRRMDGVKPIYPPTTLLCGGYKYGGGHPRGQLTTILTLHMVKEVVLPPLFHYQSSQSSTYLKWKSKTFNVTIILVHRSWNCNYNVEQVHKAGLRKNASAYLILMI